MATLSFGVPQNLGPRVGSAARPIAAVTRTNRHPHFVPRADISRSLDHIAREREWLAGHIATT
jgi:hypothetical protein